MHSFISDMAQHGMGSVAVYTRRAEALYDDNLSAYVKLTTRRFFAKLIVSCLKFSRVVTNLLVGLSRGC